ncbi:MAG: pitrilysin family protein, partial [Bdellovibrionota bacterium]
PAPIAPPTPLMPQAPIAPSAFEAQMRENLQVEKFQLANGLTVLLHVDMGVPVVAYHQWFRVGSSDEKVGRTGLAHFFEHLMFKGTPSMSGREYELAIHSNGGSNNAFTTRDYTGYYTYLPSEKLELAIKIESDRMRNLLFDAKEINSEREVVKEERRMRYENDVFGALNELLYSTVYKTSEYRWPVIGYMADLNATSLDELKSFYNTYYAPNNSVVVVAGAFDKEKAKKLIEKYYGNLKSQPIPATKYTPEAEQKSTRRAKITKPVQNLTYSMTFLAPAAGHVDNYALDLLANVLGEGTSSRLYKSVIYQSQLASSIGAYNGSSKQSGIFSISASAKPKVSAGQIENKIKAEIDKVKKDLVSKREFEKVQNQVLMSYVSSLKTIGGKARSLALNEIYFNDYSAMFKDLAEYNKVTLADIKRVANKYLDYKKASVVLVEPSGVLK